MKTYIITCLDRKNSLKKRLANRELHLEYLKNLKDKLVLAGPILNKKNKPKGSVLILKFQNRKQKLPTYPLALVLSMLDEKEGTPMDIVKDLAKKLKRMKR